MERTILFARQPIFDRSLNVFAYELLCRSGQQRDTSQHAQDKASSEVLLNAFSSTDIRQIVGNRRAFINFTENLLDVGPLFGNEYLVVEVLESVAANECTLRMLEGLKASGFTIALDDFELSTDSAPLVAYADIVKLDVLALSDDQLAAHVRELKPYGVELLAEKIESYEILEHCLSLGFDYFQGYFLSKPKDFRGQEIQESRTTVMRILAEMYKSDIDIEEIESFVAQDPVLSFKLLKLINSAAFNLVREIRCIKQAISLLGIAHFRRWTTLLALHEGSDKPPELAAATLTRAQMCLIIAKTLSPDDTDLCFTAGLFSTLDAFLDAPIGEILADLPLARDLLDAIVKRTGLAGMILNSVIAYEQARWEDIEIFNYAGFGEAEMAIAYRQSLDWVSHTILA